MGKNFDNRPRLQNNVNLNDMLLAIVVDTLPSQEITSDKIIAEMTSAGYKFNVMDGSVVDYNFKLDSVHVKIWK